MYQYQTQTVFQLTINTTVYAWIHVGFNLQVLTFKSNVPSILTIPVNSSGICTQHSNNAKYSDIPDIITIQAVILPTGNNNMPILCQIIQPKRVDRVQFYCRHSRVGNRKKQFNTTHLLYYFTTHFEAMVYFRKS